MLLLPAMESCPAEASIASLPSGWKTRYVLPIPSIQHPAVSNNSETSSQDFYTVNDDRSFKDLKKHGLLLTRYYAHTHPSQPNYLAAIAGDYFGLNHDDDIRIPENVSTIVDLLESKDISWAGYFEGLPGPGFMYQGSEDKDGNWDYVRKHK